MSVFAAGQHDSEWRRPVDKLLDHLAGADADPVLFDPVALAGCGDHEVGAPSTAGRPVTASVITAGSLGR